MGGRGSGRWYRWDTKDTTGECRSLDVRDWQRRDLLRPGHAFTWTWSRDGEVLASIGVITRPDGVRLDYSYRERGGERESVAEFVPLNWTPCHFGGRRPWFACPGVVNGRACGRRVAKLYSGGRSFLCRHCCDLTYDSRRESAYIRAVYRAQKVRLRLGGDANMTMPFPQRPKGMHRRTYERLRAAHDAADERAWEHFEVQHAGFDAWLARRYGTGR